MEAHVGLELQIDAAGCRGRVVQDEPGRLPSNGTMLRWFLTLACPTALLLGTRAPRQAFPILAGLLVFAVVAHAIRGEGGWFDWEWELNPVARRFEVANGILTVRGSEGVRTAPLAQAQVTRFEDGVQVNPALGAPVQLTWSGATADDVDRLATLLEAASAHRLDERGSRRDVPDHLEGLRQESGGPSDRGPSAGTRDEPVPQPPGAALRTGRVAPSLLGASTEPERPSVRAAANDEVSRGE